IYAAALLNNPDSYYLAGLLAQTQLELGRRPDALVNFQKALTIVERLGEYNIWSHATAATACLALNKVDGVRQHLAAIGKLAPAKLEIDSIRGGFIEVARRLGIAETTADELLGEISDQTREAATT